jgi:BirA family biotin operon repressor/biotin-[acetyl-CoA-carboxylase] ligase
MNAAELATRLQLPRVELFESVGSTLDVAHDLASKGAPAGTLIVADEQTAGRGRMGRSWRSDRGAGVWLTLIERPRNGLGLEVLSLRVGILVAPAIDRFTESSVTLKWPNDLIVDARKLGGILIEARWREGVPDWVAIGVGINLSPVTTVPPVAGLRVGTKRDDVLAAAVPAIREAAARQGLLTALELEAFGARDVARGRSCIEPKPGVVRGIAADGSLRIDVTSSGATREIAVRAGSLVFQGEA